MTPSMPDWVARFPGSVTVSDAEGVVLYMNDAAAEHYASFGGLNLLGTNMLGCHPEQARAKVAGMLRAPGSNVYTIEKSGARSLVYQTTWFESGEPAGLVALILDLPGDMPHFAR